MGRKQICAAIDVSLTSGLTKNKGNDRLWRQEKKGQPREAGWRRWDRRSCDGKGDGGAREKRRPGIGGAAMEKDPFFFFSYDRIFFIFNIFLIIF